MRKEECAEKVADLVLGVIGEYEGILVDSNNIGSVLSDLMRRKNMSAKELSFRCGISQQTISSILNGKCVPGMSTFLRIIKELDCELAIRK